VVREFTADYLARASAKSSRPYMILEVNWGTASSPALKYYSDRTAADFEATGVRSPTLESALVLEWGETAMELTDNQSLSYGTRTIALEDTQGDIRWMLDASIKQLKYTRIYRLFDHESTVWPDDAAIVFSGSIEPHTFTEDGCKVSFAMKDISSQFIRALELAIPNNVFAKLPLGSQGRCFPLALGRVHRMKCLPINGAVDLNGNTVGGTSSLAPGTEIRMDRSMSDLGVIAGTQYELTIGGDPVKGSFSAVPPEETNQNACIFTVTAGGTVSGSAVGHALMRAVWEMVLLDESAGFNGYFRLRRLEPSEMRSSFEETVTTIGSDLRIASYDKDTQTYVNVAFIDIIIDDPDEGWIHIQFAPGDNPPMDVYHPLFFYSAGSTAGIAQPGGVSVKAASTLQTIYCCNFLPSQNVFAVEAWYDGGEEVGAGFRQLGSGVRETVVGTTTVIDPESVPYVINTNDETWNGPTQLGHNISTISISIPPSYIDPAYKDDAIYVSLLGMRPRDPGEAPLAIVNPALVVLEMLTHPKIFNVDESHIDEASFAAGAAALSGCEVGCAVLTQKNGLEWLQNFARQFHSFLLLDQDKIYWKTLANSSSSFAMTFACGVNQIPVSTTDNILAGSLQISESPVEELTTHLIGSWTRFWDERSDTKTEEIRTFNQDAFTFAGRQLKTIQYDAMWRRTDVINELSFWMDRYARVYRLVTFTAFLEAAKLQPGDWIKVSYANSQFPGDKNGTHLVMGLTPFNTVHDDTTPFTSGDVGKFLFIKSQDGRWVSGIYKVTAVASGVATLDRGCHIMANGSPVGGTITQGSWALYTKYGILLNDVPCEVLRVSDKGIEGLVEIQARYTKFDL